MEPYYLHLLSLHEYLTMGFVDELLCINVASDFYSFPARFQKQLIHNERYVMKISFDRGSDHEVAGFDRGSDHEVADGFDRGSDHEVADGFDRGSDHEVADGFQTMRWQIVFIGCLFDERLCRLANTV